MIKEGVEAIGGGIIVAPAVNKLKLAVPKRALFFFAAFVWGFASYRILDLGFYDVLSNTKSYWANIAVGFIGFCFFFRYIFLRVFQRNIRRIINAKSERMCVFSFFDVKGLVTMAVMITAGIFLRTVEIIPPLYLGTFYITLGLSLLAGTLSFVYAGVRYEAVKAKYYDAVN